ncbi:hypothetical protein [Luteimonas sp. A482]
MSQNLIDLSLDAERLGRLDAALAAVETELAGMAALGPDQTRDLAKMGAKSEAFVRQSTVAFAENPGVLPRNFDLEGFQRDLASLDALRPRLQRIKRLQERMSGAEIALGSDLMNAALEGYAVLKVSGRGEGMEALKRLLSQRFSRTARSAASQPAPEPVPAG